MKKEKDEGKIKKNKKRRGRSSIDRSCLSLTRRLRLAWRRADRRESVHTYSLWVQGKTWKDTVAAAVEHWRTANLLCSVESSTFHARNARTGLVDRPTSEGQMNYTVRPA